MSHFQKIGKLFPKYNLINPNNCNILKIKKNHFSITNSLTNKFPFDLPNPISLKQNQINFFKISSKNFSANNQKEENLNKKSQDFNEKDTEEIIKNMQIKFGEVEKDINNYKLKKEIFDFLKIIKINKLLKSEKYSKFVDELFYHEILKPYEENSLDFITDILFLLYEDSSLLNEKKWEEFFTYLQTHKNKINLNIFIDTILMKLIKSHIFISDFPYVVSENTYHQIIIKQLFDIFLKEKIQDKKYFECFNFKESLLLIKIFIYNLIEEGKIKF